VCGWPHTFVFQSCRLVPSVLLVLCFLCFFFVLCVFGFLCTNVLFWVDAKLWYEWFVFLVVFV